MHYYQFNIGDYAKATRHLSNLEDLAYRRLMELYYDTEKPLPNDVKKLARLVNMRKNQVEVESILDDFFYLSDEGYRQNRIEKELAKYHRNADVARVNGKKGGRPRKPSKNPVGFENKPNPNPAESQSKANHKPITINQEPITKNKNKKTSGPKAYSEAFERWWAIFPKRNGRVRGKQTTYPLFNGILKSEYMDLKAATVNYSKEEHIRDPERFLKGGYWRDFIGEAGPIESGFKKPSPLEWKEDFNQQSPIEGQPQLMQG